MLTLCQSLYGRKSERREVFGQKGPNLINVVCERPPTERDIKLYVVNHFNDILTYWLGNCYLSAYAKESAVYLLDLDSTEIKTSRNILWCKRIICLYICFVGFWNFCTCSSWNLVCTLNFHVCTTLFNDPTRDSIANNSVISVYCRCLQILYQIAFFYRI